MADSAPVSPNEERDVRATRRVWWGLAAVFVMMLGIGAWFYLFYDLPPPDPATYHYDFKPVPPGENALEVFGRETENLRQAMKEDWNKRLSEDDHLSKLEPGCEESLRAHVEAHQELLQRYLRMVREAPRPLVYAELKETTDLITAKYSSLSPLQDGATLWRRQMMLETLTGHPAAACEQAFELAAFAKELSRMNSTLLHWLVTLTLHSQALMVLNKALPSRNPSPVEAFEMAQRLRTVELDSQDGGRSYRVELKVAVNTFAKWRENPANLGHATGSHGATWLGQRMIKPNWCIVESAQIVVPFVRALDKGWSQGMKAAQDLDRQYQAMTNRKSWRTWVHPNLLGRSLLAMSLGSYHVITHKTVHAVSLNRCLQTALALRAFELDKERLPERLEELVPAYLPAVPEDPVTGKALQWNPHTARLYSVGGDARDDGGDFDPEKPRSGDKDWGLVYPWSVRAGAKGSPP